MPNNEDKWIEGLWEARRDRLWRKAKGSPLGLQFWAEVNIDPDTDPKTLTEAQVDRLDNELTRIERLYPQTFIPFYRQEWIRDWQVPKPERWTDVPIKFTPRPEAEVGYRGIWRQWRKEMGLTKEGISPAVIAHEMAHKRYFELSPQMRKTADRILDWLEATDPEFRRIVMRAGPRLWGKRGVERHAILYQHLGRQPDRIPFYLERYYEGMKPWEIRQGLGTRRWMLREGQISPEEFYRQPWEAPRREEAPRRTWRERLEGILGR